MTMTRQEYAALAAEYTLWLLYRRKSIESGSTEACNLWALFQEGLGHCDPDPQVPLLEIVEYVRSEMKAAT